MREGRDAEEAPKHQEGAHGEATRRREQHVPETPRWKAFHGFRLFAPSAASDSEATRKS